MVEFLPSKQAVTNLLSIFYSLIVFVIILSDRSCYEAMSYTRK